METPCISVAKPPGGGDVKDQTRIVLEKSEGPCWVHMVPTSAIC